MMDWPIPTHFCNLPAPYLHGLAGRALVNHKDGERHTCGDCGRVWVFTYIDDAAAVYAPYRGPGYAWVPETPRQRRARLGITPWWQRWRFR